jgi:hypothetical protein
MTNHCRQVLCGSAVALVLLTAAGSASAQLHTTGQNVQPVFEGWQRNPDGSFTMVFGYLNRNYVEEPHIPVGPNNFFEPGPADRSQPTHFYPRRQSFVFEVIVPADWGEKQDLVWTVTHNGRTDKAYGSLWPVWEIEEGVWKANRGSGVRGRMGRDYDPNQRPSLKVLGDATQIIALPDTLTLTVSVSDDGKPGPQRQRQPTRPDDGVRPVPRTTGVPGVARNVTPATQDMVKARVAYETGLAVSWIHYRGSGKVTFDPMAVPIKSDGTAVTAVRFSDPGTHVLRAYADDGVLTTPAEVTVIVKGAVPEVRR